MADQNSFVVEHAKTGRAGCGHCKEKIDKGVLRIGRSTYNPFDEDSPMMKYFHVKCMFLKQLNQRAATNKIEHSSDLEGFTSLEDDEKDLIRAEIKAFNTAYAAKLAKSKAKKSPRKKAASPRPKAKAKDGKQATLSLRRAGLSVAAPSRSPSPAPRATSPAATGAAAAAAAGAAPHKMTGTGKDNSFYAYQQLCDSIAAHPSYTDKTNLVQKFITKGTSGDGYTGDLYLLLKMLLPKQVAPRVFNMKDKQIVKCLSAIIGCSADEMLEDLDNGDCPQTCKDFYVKHASPPTWSTMSNGDVETFLARMEGLTKLEEQEPQFRRFLKAATGDDLKHVIRLMRHDVRINAGPKHMLGALHRDAYEAFQASRDLQDVILRAAAASKPGALKRSLSIRASLMTPVKPMLAQACKTYDSAIQKCTGGMYAEIKYDGERVQIHKNGATFQYFSRSLKTVSKTKIGHFEKLVPEACPHGHSMILDAEVLMMDTETSKPLPFGTLGIHKRQAFKSAVPCLFIFDMLSFNGVNLMEKPLEERREQYLKHHVKEIRHRILHSEAHDIESEAQLQTLMKRVMNEGLEGLVLKDKGGSYEPGKRHWLKMKKDYLDEGALADSADLVVLGAYFGTGAKGGVMSTFLMGCLDASGRWRTVCKVGNGHDDATIDKINEELDVTKISKDASRAPKWLDVRSSLVPDFVVPDPKKAPVWEISGAEFSDSTDSTAHTADGISIRFPRVTKIRKDKAWDSATTLDELKHLYKVSKEVFNFGDKASAAGGAGAAAAAAMSGVVDTKKESTPTPSAMAATPAKKRKARRAYDDDDFINDDEEDDDGLDEVADLDTRPTKRARSSRRRAMCKYGATCYQTKSEHLKRFAHPTDSDWVDYAEACDDSDDDDMAMPPAVDSSSADRDYDPEMDAAEDGAPAGEPAPAEDSGIHTDDFDKPSSAPAASAPAADAGPLLDIFDGVKVFMHEDTTKFRELRRYLIAFAGEVAESPFETDVTHVVCDSLAPADLASDTDSAMSANPLARVVAPSWVWACRNAGKLLDEAGHTPKGGDADMD